jgi:uncharacterized membrane protein
MVIMSWYSWLGTYMMIIGGFLWMVIDWQIYARLIIIVFVFAGYMILKHTRDPKFDSKT